ncbi:assimilatory nitrite reductase (NAD(P)H) large subunit precursor [Sanguibacter keddieii DSM 10542]|uniref:assimilatory sulfite reductase (ferredoxin) n=1 Tax=Sanguibacter keddieii (strain ATCC 51767 / DSM 10542 / NCFB 3025 / ST-74) TaxID=446469 RepID=D1BDW0_SANKS|nr:nitrite reductase large subunit NirB [Sanguibacter keddieii]ACZ23181.1 assimilatory nitrite reductase (NAD(P)H) large subunit precursor [Sanguibacter keddieii DSM 10542]
MSPVPTPLGRIVVVGGGMVAHRFAEHLCQRSPDGGWTLTVIGDEPLVPYDRVHLSEFFTGRTPDDLALAREPWSDPRVTLVTGDAVASLDLAGQTVTTRSGRVEAYDELVLATGSWAWTPRTDGTDLPGVFTYRTMADVVALEEWVRLRTEKLGRPLAGAVVGGGVLGLEAAAALQALGTSATVVEFSDRLMSVQLDPGGGEALRVLVGDLGMDVRTSTGATRLGAGGDGAVATMDLSDGSSVPADVVVFSTGVRPRDRVAREAGLAVGERGGVVVGPTCRTSDPAVWAIGECASYEGECTGLVAPGNAMAEVVVDQLLGGTKTYETFPEGTRLKGVGVEAAAFGDVFALTPGALEVTFADPVAKTYKKLVVSDDAKTLLGGVFVGDVALYPSLRPMLGRPLGADPSAFLAPEGGAGVPSLEVPDDVVVCSCANVTAGTVRGAVTEHGCASVGEVKTCTKAGTVCGSCVPLLTKIVNTTLERSGIEVSRAMCEHFAVSRAELYDLVRRERLRTFSEIVGAHGTGRGCSVCKPVVASILSSLGPGHVLEPEQAALQDTNDHVMANMQKDGTYSVVPRVPGGEITPEKLMVIGQVAQEFGLYTRITGAQRIGMFGARIDQLPAIWARLVDAGFESGQAYGKALRNVKSCVGQAWCRFGVKDSVGMGVRLEMRYRGLRSPHKFKMGVSGCARECAEARGKDVGVIATEKGWNVYVGGNGGFTPRHADLLAEDLDDDRLVQVVDRFLALYVRSADRLQRTAPWVADYPGGIAELRRVVVDDVLGIGAELEEFMARHVESYRDEWAQTLEDPEKLSRFVSFVNAPDEHDPDLAYTSERGQVRPARAGEVADHNPVIARTLEVRR